MMYDLESHITPPQNIRIIMPTEHTLYDRANVWSWLNEIALQNLDTEE